MVVPPHRQRSAALGGLTSLEGRSWGGFLSLHTRLERALGNDLEAAAALSLSAYDVLRTLALAPGARLRLSELADAVVLGRAGLSGLVRRLENRGLVERVPAAEDGRGAYARLTGAGWERLRVAHPAHVASIRARFLSRLTEQQLDHLDECWRALDVEKD